MATPEQPGYFDSDKQSLSVTIPTKIIGVLGGIGLGDVGYNVGHAIAPEHGGWTTKLIRTGLETGSAAIFGAFGLGIAVALYQYVTDGGLKHALPKQQ